MKLKRLLKKIFFLGYKYYCPVCSSRIRFFRSLDPNNFKNHDHGFEDYETLNYDDYLCPVCYSTDRDRAIYFYLRTKIINSSAKINLLEFAPGSLREYLSKNREISYRTCDLFMNFVDDQFDIQSLGYPDSSFDILICSHVLEHVPDDLMAMRELYRVLKPSGTAILLVPISLKLEQVREDKEGTVISDEDRVSLYGQSDHLRLYSKTAFVSRLEKAGFKISESKASDFVSQFEKYGISHSTILYIGEKL